MRMLFLTLLLFNVAFFGWLEYQHSLPNPEDAAHAPLQADRIAVLPIDINRPALSTASILSARPESAPSAVSALSTAAKIAASTLPAAPEKPVALSVSADKPPTGVDKVAKACINWSGLAPAEADKVMKEMDKLGLGDKVKQVKTEEPTSYWVYVSPRSSAKEAEHKITELKELGVKDVIIISESGKWQNAISLGVFKTEEGAKKRFAELQERGVKSAQVGERTTQVKEVRLVINDLTDRADKIRALFKSQNAGNLREGC